MLMAMAKQATTIANQAALAVLDLAVEMCTKPCTVLLSKNSRNFSKTILIHLGFVIYFWTSSSFALVFNAEDRLWTWSDGRLLARVRHLHLK